MIKLTGSSGMLGSRLVYDLLTKHQNIGILVRNNHSVTKLKQNLAFYSHAVEELMSRITIFYGDITDYQSVEDFLEPGDMLYHCAAMVSFNPSDNAQIELSNTGGTANVVNASIEKRLAKLCHVSSIGALGKSPNGAPINESNFYEGGPKSAYSKSKFFSEMEVWRGIAEGLNAVIVNPAVIIGEGNWQNGSGQLFSRVHNGMPFYTLGSTSYVDVADVSNAMIMLMDSEISSERFILASENMVYRDFFNEVANSINSKAPRWYASPYMTACVWRIGAFFSSISGRPAKFTKQTHRMAHGCNVYDGSKILSKTNFTYTPLHLAIKRIGSRFLEDHN